MERGVFWGYADDTNLLFMTTRIKLRDLQRNAKGVQEMLTMNASEVFEVYSGEEKVFEICMDFGSALTADQIARKVVNMLGYGNGQSSISDDSHFIPDYQ